MKEGKKGRIVVAVTSDLATDQRVHKVCTSLIKFGYPVTLVGRKLAKSLELRERNYECRRMSLIFRGSFLFYAEYNFRLFLLLLFQRPDSILANDLDTLTAAFVYSRLFNKTLVYDSHEYFTEVPELIERPFVRKFWERLESYMLPRIKRAYTVSKSISEAYFKKYQLKMNVVRNFPILNTGLSLIKEKKSKEFLIVYQGVLNVDRGLEEAIDAMEFIEDSQLLIVGGGDIEQELKERVRIKNLTQKVVFLGQVPFEKLQTITSKADLGLSIERPVGLNYQMALPNKLFDYIHAEIPVLVSKLTEVEIVLREFKVGEFIESHEPEIIAGKIKELKNNPQLLEEMKEACKKAKQKFCWENEEKILAKIFNY